MSDAINFLEIDRAQYFVELRVNIRTLQSHGVETAGRWRALLFLLTGVAVPFYVFPFARVFQRPLDLATVLAGAFIVGSLPAVARELKPPLALFAAGCFLLPLFVLLPPRPISFSFSAFAISYAHWLLVTGFFVCALCLGLTDKARKRLLQANVIAGFLVALFTLYQVVGIPRGWPATEAMLVPFQRVPLRFEPIPGYVRPTSVFGEPAWMGGYLVWVFVLSLSLLPLVARSSKTAVLVASVVVLAGCLASVSWGAYADLLAVGLVLSATMLTLRFPKPRVVVLAWVLIALLLVGGSLSAPGRRLAGAVRDRWSRLIIMPLGENSGVLAQDYGSVRFHNARHTAELLRKHPLGGVGLGQFAKYSGTRIEVELVDVREPWCGWLAIAAEAGLGGPLLLLGAFFLVLQCWNRTRLAPATPSAVVVPALVAFAIVAQLHTASYIDLWWWYPVSVAAALARPERGP